MFGYCKWRDICCQVLSETGGRSLTTGSHFTAFAVLVDVTGALNVSLMHAVNTNLLESVLYNYICSFVGHNSRDHKVHNFIHLNLSISLLLGYVVFLSGVETAVANKVSLESCFYKLCSIVCSWYSNGQHAC